MRADHRGRTGQHSARPSKSRPGSIVDQFIPHRREWMESEAVRGLSFAARRCLDRLEIEHMAHAGKENGQLVCTYDDFARSGVRRQSVPKALAELQRAKILVVTEPGRGGNAEFRRPTRYRLTHLPTYRGMKLIDPTDDWKHAPLSPRDIESRCKTAPGTEPGQ